MPRPRGRPRKYATDEERQAAHALSTAKSDRHRREARKAEAAAAATNGEAAYPPTATILPIYQFIIERPGIPTQPPPTVRAQQQTEEETLDESIAQLTIGKILF
jgi:hypothetical protein